MEPPGLSESPSRVTTLYSYLNFFSKAIALSILSITMIRPSRLPIRFLYTLSYSTSSLAIPTTPFSFKNSVFENVLFLIAESGKNIALPNLFFFR